MLGTAALWATRLTGRSYFLRREVWELLLRLLGAEAAWPRAESLGAGLSSRAGGDHQEGRGPSRACMTLMAPTVRMSPQSKVGASRGDSWLRNQWRAWARALLALRHLQEFVNPYPKMDIYKYTYQGSFQFLRIAY